jgi:4a-hydroxytetrahydrobiopterin dehydratase
MERLTRTAASEAVGDLGWRYVLGTLATAVRTGSLAAGADVVRAAVDAAGPAADARLWCDVRAGAVVLHLQTLALDAVTAADVEAARRVTQAVRALGLAPDPAGAPGRSVQLVEIAVDTQDPARVRPFWAAVLGYVDAAGDDPDDPWAALVDPLRQGPAVWFQEMDAPRPQRNRLHLDVSVPHDEAAARIRSALAAGGRLLDDGEAPSFCVLADAAGNEVCVTTWQGRD